METLAIEPGAAGVNMQTSSLKRLVARRRQRRALVLGTIVILFLLLAVAGSALYRARSDPRTTRPVQEARLPEALAQPQSFKPLTVDEALDANSKLPFTDRRDVAASGFVLKADSDNRGRAIECLAQAIYYEAASEGEAGQRAVAQVVLNRMRHPGYPASVCGVVYQGSERVMGCQFTFTCDGSLLRRPNAAMFAGARKIAIEALAGRVYGAVGHATNYHADYVLPYWAASLDKQAQVGRHIFYRLKGGLGSTSAFGQRYAGREPVVVPQSTIILTAEALAQSDEVLASELSAAANDESKNPIIVADAIIREPLVADQGAGELIGGGAIAAPKKTKPTAAECPTKNSTKILPTAPSEMRSGAKEAC